jgi:Bacterial membrane protein YfhO
VPAAFAPAGGRGPVLLELADESARLCAVLVRRSLRQPRTTRPREDRRRTAAADALRMPDQLTLFGPLNHPLDLRLEATYGYNPLEFAAYAHYREAMQTNLRLQNGLNLSRSLDPKTGAVSTNPDVLPRAYFARSVTIASNLEESRRQLQMLDPAAGAIVMGAAPAGQADPQATVAVTADGEQAYRIRYRTSAPALLKVSVPYYPGWEASVDGRRCDVIRVDHHALMGVVAPAGEKELLLRFRSMWFGVGAWISGLMLAACGALLVWRRAREPIRPAARASDPPATAPKRQAP